VVEGEVMTGGEPPASQADSRSFEAAADHPAVMTSALPL
jgi:hypothetical protein